MAAVRCTQAASRGIPRIIMGVQLRPLGVYQASGMSDVGSEGGGLHERFRMFGSQRRTRARLRSR